METIKEFYQAHLEEPVNVAYRIGALAISVTNFAFREFGFYLFTGFAALAIFMALSGMMGMAENLAK
jgi:hypothetical protein